MAFCLDTCHMFAAGYDIRTPEAYAATGGVRPPGRCTRYWRFHFNDSKKGSARGWTAMTTSARAKSGPDSIRPVPQRPAPRTRP